MPARADLWLKTLFRDAFTLTLPEAAEKKAVLLAGGGLLHMHGAGWKRQDLPHRPGFMRSIRLLRNMLLHCLSVLFELVIILNQ